MKLLYQIIENIQEIPVIFVENDDYLFEIEEILAVPIDNPGEIGETIAIRKEVQL